MRGTENTITMLGEQMEDFICAGCLSEYIIGTSKHFLSEAVIAWILIESVFWYKRIRALNSIECYALKQSNA